LPKKDREFVVYESSLSDIIGVLWFNFFIIYAVPSWSNVLNYGIIFILSIIAAILFSGISSFCPFLVFC
jgi:small-conductance mechanosensitive channel